MKYLIIGVIALTVITTAFSFIRNLNNSKLAGQLAQFLMDEKFKEFDSLINEIESKKKLPIFNIVFLKLNKAIILDNSKEIGTILSEENTKKLSYKEQNIVYRRAFYYYLNKKESTNTKKYYELIKKLNRKDFVEIDRLYDTYIDNGFKYLDDTIAKLSEAKNDQDKAQLELLISNMYANKKDKDNTDKYLKLAQEHLKTTA